MEPDARQPDLEPDERVASLVNEYFDRREAGEDLTPEQFASEHPELAGELQPYLEGLSFLDRIRSTAPDVQAALEATPVPGQLPVVEGYELIEEKGRGGMGVVYKALQVSTKRIVALKVLLAGPFASAPAQRRFEREVELAARLRHPSIVTVLESGQVAAGQQYFAMDYVDGVHLDTYVNQVEPDVRSTLNLFIKVCDAVEYAHGQGVVHRDLKPANLLIDDQGEPHILDFGLAKAMDRSEAEDLLSGHASVPGQVMGTLKYLSPEQAAGTPAEVDVRTDVYTLGVMLYQALTGSLPYDTSGRPSEVIRRILEAPPTAPALLSSRIDAELETILLGSLEKEKHRRYETVGKLGEDLRRYLAGEPLDRKRTSRWYVFRKRLPRYRSRAAVGAAALALGLVGVWGGVLWSQYVIDQQRARELSKARGECLRMQRDLEAGSVRAVLHDAYTAPTRYPQVLEARLVAAQIRFEAQLLRAESEEAEEDEGMEDVSPAMWFLKEQLRGDPTLWPCRALLAEICYYRYEEQTALADRLERELLTREVVSSSPVTAPRWAKVQTLREKAARWKEDADKQEAQAEREAPDSAEAWYLRSFTKLDLRGPLRCANRALARNPKHALAWERLTYLADQLGDLDDALEGVNQLAGLDPDNPTWPARRNYLLKKMRELELEHAESAPRDAKPPQEVTSPGDAQDVAPADAGRPDPLPYGAPSEASSAQEAVWPTTRPGDDGP